VAIKLHRCSRKEEVVSRSASINRERTVLGVNAPRAEVTSDSPWAEIRYRTDNPLTSEDVSLRNARLKLHEGTLSLG